MVGDVVPAVERIAVLRANALGDLMFALPALEALRTAYPTAEIDLLAAPWAARFLRDRPSPVDHVVPVPTIPGLTTSATATDPAAVDRFVEERRQRRYDLALQLHGGGGTSNPLVTSLGARVTVGLRARDAAPLDRWVRYEYWYHEVLRLLEVVGLVGARPVGLEPRLTVVDADLAEADGAFGGALAGTRLAVLHPGATDPRRRWPPDRFAAVGDALAAVGLAVAVVGDAHDAGAAAAVVDAMAYPARSLAGTLSLGGLVGLLDRAEVVVANDSGPLHVARAVGAPTVGIYWCGNAINAGLIRGSRHRVALSWQLECPVCGVLCTSPRSRCPHNPSFVDRVGVDEVVGHALDVLGPTGDRPPPLTEVRAPGTAEAKSDGVDIDVLIPTCDRPAALAVTLTSLVGQIGPRFRVVVSDQSASGDPFEVREVVAAVNVLRATGRSVECLRHLPRRGIAEHRQFLLEQATAPYVLFLDDDVICESDLLARLHGAIRRAGCGFVGSFVNAPGSVDSNAAVDEPPPEVRLELWDGPVRPEVVLPDSPSWERRHLHFAAYLRRLAARSGIDRTNERLYKVAWVGGCVLFDTAVLRDAGGFGFWDELDDRHVGEDVVAQLRVMAVAGGAGLIPSGAWHQEVPTTMPHELRTVDAPHVLLDRGTGAGHGARTTP